MADLIGKIKGKIDQGISKVNVKSKELIEKQKIKLQISELEAEKKLILVELGNLTHQMIQETGQVSVISTKDTKLSKSAKNVHPDKWELSVLNVLSNICDSKLENILFENTGTEFKITAKSLLAEVQKSLPKSEQKGQNLQWLGRVLGKFGIASRKYSKRINGKRETVYEFERINTAASLNRAANKRVKTDTKAKNINYSDRMISKSRKIDSLEDKIKKLKEKLSEVTG